MVQQVSSIGNKDLRAQPLRTAFAEIRLCRSKVSKGTVREGTSII